MKIYLGLITAAVLSLAACGDNNNQTASTAPATETSAPATEAPASAATPAASEATPATPAASETAPAAAAPTEASPEAKNTVPTASAECATEITSDDAMKYDPKEITIKSSCKQYTITLHHAGKMPASAMGHNVVVTKTADKDGVLADGASAGEKENYVKPGDERVIAHTKLIGGGQTDSITFDVSKLAKGEAYEYFCSFPGHYAMMNGKIILAD